MWTCRGQVLIIDNEDFNELLNKRTGSLVDANNLDILFQELGKIFTSRKVFYTK